MSVSGNFVDITLDDFRSMGDRLEVRDVERTLEEVVASIAQWRNFATTAMVDPATTKRIALDLDELRPR
jgi:hypothetical protein